MPELLSRMDYANWITPAIADVLDQGESAPGGDGSIREYMLSIQKELSDLNTPARIINVRSQPSHTLFVARPEIGGRQGNRQATSLDSIEASILEINKAHADWLLGFMPEIRNEENAFGILMRTREHRPPSLRRLIVRNTFRRYPSQLSFPVGITLDQRVIISDLDVEGHVLIRSTDRKHQHLVRGMLLTLLLLNTPGELRLAIVSNQPEPYQAFISSPHALGKLVSSAAIGKRLIDGLAKEVQRRRQTLSTSGIENFDEYNSQMREHGVTELPRVLLLLDALSDPEWQKTKDDWMPNLIDVFQQGARYGIHIICVIDNNDEKSLGKLVANHIVFKSAAGLVQDKTIQFHPTLINFIEAYLIQNRRNNDPKIEPIEIYSVSNSEIRSAIEYWQSQAVERQQATSAGVSGKTGVTDILILPDNYAIRMSPPVPPPPTTDTLQRATIALGGTGSLERKTQTRETAVIQADPEPQSTQLLAEEEPQIINQEVLPISEATGMNSELITRAKALANYLGWLGISPLQDIFGLSEYDAHDVLTELKNTGYIESVDHPTPRVVRPSR